MAKCCLEYNYKISYLYLDKKFCYLTVTAEMQTYFFIPSISDTFLEYADEFLGLKLIFIVNFVKILV